MFSNSKTRTYSMGRDADSPSPSDMSNGSKSRLESAAARRQKLKNRRNNLKSQASIEPFAGTNREIMGAVRPYTANSSRDDESHDIGLSSVTVPGTVIESEPEGSYDGENDAIILDVPSTSSVLNKSILRPIPDPFPLPTPIPSLMPTPLQTPLPLRKETVVDSTLNGHISESVDLPEVILNDGEDELRIPTPEPTIVTTVPVIVPQPSIEESVPTESSEPTLLLPKAGPWFRRIWSSPQQTTSNYECIKWLKTFVVDTTNDNWYYYWTAIVSVAFVYNLLVIIARAVFEELNGDGMFWYWLVLDVLADIIYCIDMFIKSRTGYLEQGLIVRDTTKTWINYKTSMSFKIDFFGILFLDLVINYICGIKAIYLRLNRIVRADRVKVFMENTETRTSYPNAFRVGTVVSYIIVIIHWNACFYFVISEFIGLNSDAWVYGTKNIQSLPNGVYDSLTRRYVYSFYWSTLILTTIGEVPGPVINIEFVFVTIDLMCGVLIFATIVGNVGSMITNMSAHRTEFQSKIDSIKQYMTLRKVSKPISKRVIKWFDYLWTNKQSLSDQEVLKLLPEKLQMEIAMEVHYETLKKVRIFQDCEEGLLSELVLKLQLQVFSPGDFICRKGDIGREMYIVKKGKLEVLSEDYSTVFTVLQDGNVFGELSILNIKGNKHGNRRTAHIRSIGYTDLFVLKKTDLWTALKEYPEAKKMLINKGREILLREDMLQEDAPENHATTEEIAEEVQGALKVLQTRLARVIAEKINTEAKLNHRIDYLESKLRKYMIITEAGVEESVDNPKRSTRSILISPSSNKRSVSSDRRAVFKDKET